MAFTGRTGGVGHTTDTLRTIINGKFANIYIVLSEIFSETGLKC